MKRGLLVLAELLNSGISILHSKVGRWLVVPRVGDEAGDSVI